DVGGVAAREEDAGGLPEVGGEGLLELDVGALGAADEARGAGADAVGLEVETDGVEEGGVAREAQIVVAREAEQAAPVDLDVPAYRGVEDRGTAAETGRFEGGESGFGVVAEGHGCGLARAVWEGCFTRNGRSGAPGRASGRPLAGVGPWPLARPTLRAWLAAMDAAARPGGDPGAVCSHPMKAPQG